MQERQTTGLQLPRLRTPVRSWSPARIQSSLRGLGFGVARTVALIADGATPSLDRRPVDWCTDCAILPRTKDVRLRGATRRVPHTGVLRPACSRYGSVREPSLFNPKMATRTSPVSGCEHDGGIEPGIGRVPYHGLKVLSADQRRSSELYQVSHLVPQGPWLACTRLGQASRSAVSALLDTLAVPSRTTSVSPSRAP